MRSLSHKHPAPSRHRLYMYAFCQARSGGGTSRLPCHCGCPVSNWPCGQDTYPHRQPISARPGLHLSQGLRSHQYPGGSGPQGDVWWQSGLVAHDVWANSTAGQDAESGVFEQSIFLGDSGYPLRTYLLNPVTNPTMQAEHSYNTAHVPATWWRARLGAGKCASGAFINQLEDCV